MLNPLGREGADLGHGEPISHHIGHQEQEEYTSLNVALNHSGDSEDVGTSYPEPEKALPSRLKELWQNHGKTILVVLLMLVVNLSIGIALMDNDKPSDDFTLKFLVIGDWGRDGAENQTAVAKAMAKVADRLDPEFIISTGDNFYEHGLLSTDDPQFKTSFSDVYNAHSLQVPWHVILGNHDYGENEPGYPDKLPAFCGATNASCEFGPLSQLALRLHVRDRRWHCERMFQLTLAGGQVDLFFMDTNPFILDYHLRPWANNTGGIAEQSWESQLLELEYRLATSQARWKLFFGHHPVRNNHLPFNTPELVQHLEPLLTRYGVQAYFSGHEHNMQYLHLEGAPTHYVVSGGGSKTDYYPEQYWDNGGSIWQHQGSGFLAVTLTENELQCDIMGMKIGAEPLYKLRINLPLDKEDEEERHWG
ncbi:hypothetical protein WJX72_000331 [[Myrmecia] bisecta]|uniref:Calcineurin-like phosphoesterase domain-containing protein n=1 Tax=[Myrmecia] bisecta TaxID=41462 RepID=A0AAW1R447_9CHLO